MSVLRREVLRRVRPRLGLPWVDPGLCRRETLGAEEDCSGPFPTTSGLSPHVESRGGWGGPVSESGPVAHGGGTRDRRRE